MTSLNGRIGAFTTENIVAVLRAVPETDGKTAHVIVKAREYGANLGTQTLNRWIYAGHADIRDGRNQTAFARFTKRYEDIKREFCGSDANRTRELDRAFEILERTCDCGNTKETLPDGSLDEVCRECREIESKGRPRLGPSTSLTA